jgi:hypothetical protein
MNVSPSFDIGRPELKLIWVDPAAGDDTASGVTRAQALKTVTAAWKLIPGGPLEHGWQIMLCPGRYTPDATGQLLLQHRRGSQAAPIVLQAADGPGSTELPQTSFKHCAHIYLIDLNFSAPGISTVIPSENMVLHFASCERMLVRRVSSTGLDGPVGMPKKAFKANQCFYIYVEDCDFSGASENAIDYVAVQYGHIVRNRLHNTRSECMYVKGGSAHHLIAGNEMFDSRNVGVQAGQCTGFQYMVPPWLHYEAYDIKIVNNVIHDAGGGLGIAGGYNILMAWNTCYRVGSNRDTIVVGLGGRGWNGSRPAIVDVFFGLGGWCNQEEGVAFNIPNRNVLICNNVIYNPDGYESQFAHIGLSGPVTTRESSNLPLPARADDGLAIRGNVIWNGPANKPLFEEIENMYHLAARPNTDARDLLRLNAINAIRPELADPDRGNFRPVPGGKVYTLQPAEIPNFNWNDAPSRPPVPAGNPDNQVLVDRVGNSRGAKNCIGAYV